VQRVAYIYELPAIPLRVRPELNSLANGGTKNVKINDFNSKHKF